MIRRGLWKTCGFWWRSGLE